MSTTTKAIEFIEFWLVNINGCVKAMVIPVVGEPPKTLADLKKNECLKKGCSIDGSSIGFAVVENSDMRLKPDKTAVYEFPSFGGHRRVVCLSNIIYRDTLKPHGLDSRFVLEEVKREYLKPEGFEFQVKIEPEFYLIKKGTQEPLDNKHYAEVYPYNIGQKVLYDICSDLRKQSIPVIILHHECGSAQYEVELNFTEVFKACDNVMIFKNLARVHCEKNNMEVNYMPKPFIDQAGSGQHIHMKLFDKKGVNVFGVKGKPNTISEIGKHFIAGLMKNCKAITALGNPIVNSYKRLVPHQEAPIVVSWGYFNRTALIRVPMFGDPEKAAIEIRSPDFTCNPYLVLSSIIAAGMEGIKSKLKVCEPCKENIFNSTEKFEELPTNLNDSLKELEKNKLVQKAIGEKMSKAFLKTKHKEWDEYLHHVITDWEWRKYKDM